jgi:hypothetical protein
VTVPAVDEALGGLRLLACHNGVIEVRILNTRKGTISGYFDDLELAARAIARWDGTATIYATANPVNPALLARAHNRLVEYARVTTSDADILRRRWLLVDLDPVRPAGISATDAEVTAALSRRNELVTFVANLDFPDAVLAMSGNGAHAIWPVDLPNDAETTRLVEQALQALHHRFSDPVVRVDEAVFNAARIWKVYGTVAVKGDATGDRPHRRALIESAPDKLVDLPREALERLAAMAPRPNSNGSRPVVGERFDLVGAFTARSWYKRQLHSGKHSVICPWQSAHSGDSGITETCLFEPKMSGEPWGFDCKHAHCTQRTIKDVLEVLGLRRNGHGASEASRGAAVGPLKVPNDGMIGLARDFAELYARYLESPMAFFYFTFLAYFGALIAKRATLDSELRPEPRLYVVLIGESADTRKSTALRFTDEFFRSLGVKWDPPVLYGVGSAEGIAAELKERSDLLLQFDEMKAFVDKAKNEHSVALPMVTTLFERGDYDNRVKAERLSIRGASLSLVAACTADTYATMFDQRFFAIGLLNRLWLVTDRATARIAVPRSVPAEELDRLRQRVQQRLEVLDQAYVEHGMRPVPYKLTPPALAQFRAWYEARSGSLFERRLDTYGHRLMVLLAATMGKTVIDDEIVSAVLSLLRYQLDARRECDPVDAESTIAALEERIRRALARGPVKGRDLKRRLNYQRSGLWAWNTAVANLLQAGEIEHDPKADSFWLSSLLSSPENGG